MSFFKCKMCGGTIEFEPNSSIGVCDSCGTKQTLPRLDDDRRANLYDRANHFRRNNDYDKAMGIYEQILNEDNTDAEAYWSLVLCRYGIEYVEDPSTHKRVPTINRTQFSSVFADEDYKSAIAYSDTYQRILYEQEAKAIDEIQKGILSIAQKEDPFDIFICYKETDSNGRRTPDSVLANDLYHQLTQEGFKVFFSRITLEDKLGIAYEPYIFAALNSSKVMIVLGTKPEYLNSVWVKNEWSRYLALIKKGEKKTLIPAYRDMDPYDLPDEFSHLQALDMSKLGFVQDLIRGIKKILPTEIEKVPQKTGMNVYSNPGTAPLLERALLFLEDGKWEDADNYCERVLDIEPRNAEAYVVKLMAELHVRRRNQLANVGKPFDNSTNYRNALRFGDKKLEDELDDYIIRINERNENARRTEIYNNAKKLMLNANTEDEFRNIACGFRRMGAFKDAAILAEECEKEAVICGKNATYNKAIMLMRGLSIDSYERASRLFMTIPGWKDADTQAEICQREIESIIARREAERVAAERRAEEARIAAEKAARRKKKLIVISVSAVSLCILVGILLTKVIIPNQKYKAALNLKKQGEYEKAISAFEELDGYKDSEDQIVSCQNAIKDLDYDAAIELKEEGNYLDAISAFKNLDGYKDSKDQITICQNAIKDLDYDAAIALKEEGRYEEAISAFKELDGYKDSKNQITSCWNEIKELDYKAAVALRDEGKYEEAITAFEKISGYKDSKEQVEACQAILNEQAYNDALALIDEGKYEEAYLALLALKGYEDSAEKANEIYVKYETEKLKSAKVGDIVVLGTYEQDNISGNGKESIEWVVLEKENDRLLVISRYVLDCQKYHSSRSNTTWENCSLRSWLNNTFLNEAFRKEEQSMIQRVKVSAEKNPNYPTKPGSSTNDKVFLLSISEAEKYFPTDKSRTCSPTLYAKAQGAWTKDEYKTPEGKPTCWWWLRTPGEDQQNAANIYRDGPVDYKGDYVNFEEDGVRPAMWIKVNN